MSSKQSAFYNYIDFVLPHRPQLESRRSSRRTSCRMTALASLRRAAVEEENRLQEEPPVDRSALAMSLAGRTRSFILSKREVRPPVVLGVTMDGENRLLL